MAISCMDAFFFSTWQEPITPQLHTNLPSWKKIGGLHTPLARLTFVNAYLESPRPAICWSFQPKRCWSSCYGSGCHDARAVCYFSKHVGWKYDGTVLPQPIQRVSPFFVRTGMTVSEGAGPHKVVLSKRVHNLPEGVLVYRILLKRRLGTETRHIEVVGQQSLLPSFTPAALSQLLNSPNYTSHDSKVENMLIQYFPAPVGIVKMPVIYIYI